MSEFRAAALWIASFCCLMAGLAIVFVARAGEWLAIGALLALCGAILGTVLSLRTRREVQLLHDRARKAMRVELGLREELQVLRDSVSSLKQFDDEAHRLKTEAEAQNAALSEANARLERLATSDPLTRLLNHHAIVDELDREAARALSAGRRFAVLFVDLDHFKVLNDTYGHQAGDETLLEFASLLRATLGPTSVAGRWGGEEFLAILPETDHTGGMRIAEALRAEAAEHRFVSGEAGRVTCSIGLAVYPEDGRRSNTLVAAADGAMYAAKRLGRNQVRAAADIAVNALERAHDHSDRHEELELAGTVEALAELVAARDHYSNEQCLAIVGLARGMAGRLGIRGEGLRLLGMAVRLHDIGKVAVPDCVLVKEGEPFTEEEWRLMRRHVTVGAEVVEHIPALRPLAPIIRSHHERWDGRGYPDGLAAGSIPLGARIVAVAGAYRALTADRPYQQCRSRESAIEELRRCSGTQFDPAVVEALAAELGARPAVPAEKAV